MAYIPPAVHQRAVRPGFFRPSGEGGVTPDVLSDAPTGMITIRGLPRDATVRINDIPTLGSRTGAGGIDWTGPAPNDLVSVRVVNADGSSRGASAVPPAVLDYAAMAVTGGTPDIIEGGVWTARARDTSPVGTLTLVGGLAGWTYIIAPASATTPALLADAVAAGLTRSGTVVAGNTVVAPPLPLGSYSLLIGRPDSMGGGTAPVRNVVVTAAPAVDIISNAFPSSAPTTGQLTVTGMPGWTVAIALPGSTVPLAPPATIPPTGGITVPAPVGSYDLAVSDGTRPIQVRRITVTAAGLTVDTRSFFDAVGGAPAATTANLTVTGMPGWTVAIALPGSTTPLTAPATIPATGGITVPAPVGSYDLAVSDGTRPIQVRRITVTAAGLTVDTRSFFDAVGGAPAATTANLTVTGTAGWMLTLTPADSSAFVNRLPILANGTVAFPVTPGSYTLKVEDGAGHAASQSITVPAAGLTVDVGPWLASQIRTTQGPTSADPAKGTVRLSGAPPQSVVAMPAAGLTHTVDATGRPVALDVLPGTYALTVTPIGSAPRAQSVTVVAGQTVDVTYGAMPTPSAQTDGTGLQPVDAMCGPVLNRAALPWAPATACPGNELTAPDGSRYRALASTGGVTLMQLKADGTVADAGMSLGTKVLIVGVVAAAGYAGWMWYSHRKPSGKQENPGKCSCGG